MEKNRLRLIVMAVLGGVLALSPLVRAADATTETKPEVKTEVKTDTKTDVNATTTQVKRVNRLQQLAKELSLTDEQKTKIKPILADQLTKMKELREEKADRKEMAKLRTETNAKIRGVLTTEQQAKFDKLTAPRVAIKVHKKTTEKDSE